MTGAASLMLGQMGGLFAQGWLAAAGAAAVTIPIAIHLLSRLRRKPVAWAAMRFLAEAYRRQKHRLRLEEYLLLLVRCLVVLLLGFALAQPLLGGLGRQLGVQSGGRVIYLLIDDALSSRAVGPSQQSRFEAHRRQALAMLDALGPEDRVSLWLAGRPVERPVEHPTSDHRQVREAIEALAPRYSRSALDTALGDLSEAVAQQGDRDPTFVVVLSDFSRNALDLSEAAAAGAPRWGSHVTLLASHPAEMVPNVQIKRFEPRRHMLLAAGSQPLRIGVEVELRRISVDADDAATVVEIEARATPGGPIVGTATLRHRWQTGQSEALLAADLVLDGQADERREPAGPAETPARSDAPSDGQILLRAQIGSDALAEDNVRLATVLLRKHLSVALVDSLGAAMRGDTQLDPAHWLRLALSLELGQEGPAMDLVQVPAEQFGGQSITTLDAALVLRPDLLRESGWAALRALAAQGGLVWLFIPAADAPLLWGQALREQLDMDWRLGLDVLTPVATVPAGGRRSEAGAAQDDAPAADEVPDEATAPVWTLYALGEPPDPLRMLASDWQSLLTPVTVQRRVAIEGPNISDEAWLNIVPADGSAGPDGPAGGPSTALLAGAPLGDGYILLMGTALHPDWTTLPAKPLFIPLVYETLRGVLGESGVAARLGRVVAGDQPALSGLLAQAESLRMPDGTRVGLRPAQASELSAGAAASADRTVIPMRALERPGHYVPQPAPRQVLVVNADAEGGQTRPLDEQALERYFGSLGTWRWLEAGAAAAAVSAELQKTSLGWPLLWLVLGLLVLETLLARWFSHAKSERRESMLYRLRKRLGEEGA